MAVVLEIKAADTLASDILVGDVDDEIRKRLAILDVGFNRGHAQASPPVRASHGTQLATNVLEHLWQFRTFRHRGRAQ
jgi:hypothetical protein